MPREPSTINIRLGDVPVGTLTHLDERIEFAFLDEYLQLYPRPVLGQAFEDDLTRRHSSRVKLPSFFSNLLPEGPLRELIAKRQDISKDREFFLLARLGADLPGAIVATPASELSFDETESSLREEEPKGSPDQGRFSFSLAGVQLKFSAFRQDRGLTLFVTGPNGDWIVKLPDNRYDHVPANEFSMMSWARAAGIDVPNFELIQVATVGGLPEGLILRESQAFAIRRFDRPSAAPRVHIEDFAQILGLYPSEKYEKSNYETLAKIILNVTGMEGLREFLRRLVFIAAIGNADAHNKNWSLIYPDGVSAKLSPAYDLVSTIQYIPDDELALNLARSKKFGSVSMASFARLARKVGVDEAAVTGTVRAAVDATLQSWRDVQADLPIPKEFKRRIEAHFDTVPLLKGR